MNEKNNNKNSILPQIITSLRPVLTIIYLFIYFIDLIGLTIGIFLLAVFTDIIDGIFARKLNACTKFGSFFDVTTDFFLIIIAFLIFVIDGIFPYWILLIIGFMFFQFIVTSRSNRLIYDPVGKRMFLVLIIIVIITLIDSNPILCCFNIIVIIGFSIFSLITRYLFLTIILIFNNKSKYIIK